MCLLLPPLTGSSEATYFNNGNTNAYCDQPCGGDKGQICGGTLSLSIYEISIDCTTTALVLPAGMVETARTAASVSVKCGPGYYPSATQLLGCYGELNAALLKVALVCIMPSLPLQPCSALPLPLRNTHPCLRRHCRPSLIMPALCQNRSFFCTAPFPV